MMHQYLTFNKLILLLLIAAGLTITPTIGFSDVVKSSDNICVVSQSDDDGDEEGTETEEEDPEC